MNKKEVTGLVLIGFAAFMSIALISSIGATTGNGILDFIFGSNSDSSSTTIFGPSINDDTDNIINAGVLHIPEAYGQTQNGASRTPNKFSKCSLPSSLSHAYPVYEVKEVFGDNEDYEKEGNLDLNEGNDIYFRSRHENLKQENENKESYSEMSISTIEIYDVNDNLGKSTNDQSTITIESEGRNQEEAVSNALEDALARNRMALFSDQDQYICEISRGNSETSSTCYGEVYASSTGFEICGFIKNYKVIDLTKVGGKWKATVDVEYDEFL